MLNALLYTFILYHILFLIICDAFMCVHCIVFYSSATEALINNNNNNNELFNGVRQLIWRHLSPVVSTFSTSIRLLSSFFI